MVSLYKPSMKMNKIVLVTRPKYDDGTEYLSYYASLILKKAG